MGTEIPESRSETSTVPVLLANLEFFRGDPNDFLSQLITMEEIWLYHYDPETKQPSVEWRHGGLTNPNFWVQKSDGKFLESISWYQVGILLID